MTFGNLIPWRKQEVSKGDDMPITSLHRHVNRLFDDFFSDFGIEPFRGFEEWETRFMPRVGVAEDDQNVKITAELPGMTEKDVEVQVTEDSVTIKGERKQEKKENSRGVHRSELSYGSFVREIPLPASVKTDKSEGVYKNGILTITLPKTEESKANCRKIPIKSE